MNEIWRLKNPVMEYAWGSRTVIQSLLGKRRSAGRPMAELWMGAHPRAPSAVKRAGRWQSLGEVTAGDPRAVLGVEAAARFGGRFPFLFKLLAAEEPLSIQAHPDRSDAQAGYVRENRSGLPPGDPARSYQDPIAKPEMLCALTPFEALIGFREVAESLELLTAAAGRSLAGELTRLRETPNAAGVKDFLASLFGLNAGRRQEVLDEAVRFAGGAAGRDTAFGWVLRLHAFHPGDMGVLAPLLLNFIRLEPGEAVFIGPGQLHAYLNGAGLEIMAGSDNVVRAGLTRKPVNPAEVLRIGRFETGAVSRLRPSTGFGCEASYPRVAEEFRLSVIRLQAEESYSSPPSRGVEILFCLEGEAAIRRRRAGRPLLLKPGQSVLVPAAAEGYRIAGPSTLYKAAGA